MNLEYLRTLGWAAWNNGVRKVAAPLILLLEPSQRCNARCPFCYHHVEKPEGPELSLDEIEVLLLDAWCLGCRVLYLSGGEPTLLPDLQAILKTAARLGFRTSVTTNGSRLAEQVPALVGLVEGITLSIDHAGPEHDGLRGLPGLYQSAVNGLMAASRAGIACRINMTLGTGNRDQVEPLMALARGIGAGLHVRLLTRESTMLEVEALTRAEAQKEARCLLSLKRRHPKTLITPASYFKHVAKQRPFTCRLLSLLVNVDSSGRVYVPCPKYEGTKERIAGSIRKQRLATIWMSKDADDLRREAAACRPTMDCYTSCLLDISLLAGLDPGMLFEQALGAGSLFRYFWR